MRFSRILQVIISCIICQIPNTNSTKDEVMSNNRLTEIPGLDILKDVTIWKDNQNTSLSKMFGPNTQDWTGNFEVITDVALTALCCLYSSKTFHFLKRVEQELTRCADMTDIFNIIKSLNSIKEKLNSMRRNTVQMLTTLINYSNKFHALLNKNVLNAFMSFYLYVNIIKTDKSEYSIGNEPNTIVNNFSRKFLRMKLYTQNLLEAFLVLNCSWESFDGSQLNLINGYDDTILFKFKLPVTNFKHDYFNTKSLLLTNVADIQYEYTSNYNRLGCITVDFNNRSVWLNRYYQLYAEEYRSEIITKSQTIVFQTIVLPIFYLIRALILKSIQSGQPMDSHTETCVNNAIILLGQFNFPGSLRVQLRKILYQKMLSTSKSKVYNKIFNSSQIINNLDIQEKFSYSPDLEKKYGKLSTGVLERLTKSLQTIESDIKEVRGINEDLCDYEYEEVGLLQHDSSTHIIGQYKYEKVGFLQTDNVTFESTQCTIDEPKKLKKAIPILKSLKKNNLQFSFFVVVHFILVDFIISLCESIKLDENNLHMSDQLKSCFDFLIKSIVLIGDTLDYSLNTITKTLNLTRPYNNANRKVIDSILAMKLYFSNDNLLNSRVPLTEQGSVDKNGVLSKLDAMKRSHRFITGLIEQYTIHNCPTPLPREEFTKSTITLLNEYCRSVLDKKDRAEIIRCVKIIIDENLKNYETDESQANTTEYTVETLLLGDVWKKAMTKNSSLSFLYEISISWNGKFKRLTEIVDFVKNNIHPKFLSKYQLTIIQSIFFIAYEKMKTIIQTSITKENFLIYSNKIDAMVDALNFICREYFPIRLTNMYEMILAYFKGYFQNDTSININTLIRVIEVEQYYLGFIKETSEANVNEIRFSISNLILETVSESPDVEMTDSSGLEIDMENSDGQGNINQLVMFIGEMKEIWSSVKNVALVLDVKQMNDVQIY